MYWGHGEQAVALPLWISLPVLFGSAALLFACIAQETARCFRKYPPLTAYSIDIGGSLAGIAFFTLHSQLRLPPIAWFAVAFVLAVGSPWTRRGGSLVRPTRLT